MIDKLASKEDVALVIKQAVKIGHSIPIEVNHRTTMFWWRKINYSLFDSKLKPPKKLVFKWFYLDTYGWCVPFGKAKKDGKRRVSLGMSTELNFLDRFLVILVHEMVHQWEWEINNDWNDTVKHGRAFYSWRDKIKELYDIPLTAKYDF